jgi:hypothetical protein
VAEDWENIPEDFVDQEAREEVAMDYTLVIAYIKGVDHTRYRVFVSELKNNYVKGQKYLATAFALVNLYETPENDQLQQHLNHHQVHNQQHYLIPLGSKCRQQIACCWKGWASI